MYPTTIEDDVRSIVAAEIVTPYLIAIDSSINLAEIEFEIEPFLTRLDLKTEDAGSSEQMTVGEVIALLDSNSDAIRDSLWELATKARLTRILQGILLASEEPPVNEEMRWWYALAAHILWRYARGDGDHGLELVQNNVPERAAQMLTDLGILDFSIVARDEDSDAATCIDILERIGYSEKVAENTYKVLVAMAQKISQQSHSKLQQRLR